MREFKDKGLNNRLQESQRAKAELLRRASEVPKADPAELAKRAAEAEERKAERARKAERKAELAREQAAQLELEKARLAVLAEEAAREAAAQKIALESEQKAARDARYAARKNRKG